MRRDADDGGEIFREAVRGTTPLPDRGRVRVAGPSGPEKPQPRARRAKPRADERKAFRLEASGGRAFGVSRQIVRDLATGRLPVESSLDLHRHTSELARQRLTKFLRDSRAAGLRVVLVITGKGERSRSLERLRELVPDWLAGPLSPAILAFTPARAEHGGAGALYVLLRTATS